MLPTSAVIASALHDVPSMPGGLASRRPGVKFKCSHLRTEPRTPNRQAGTAGARACRNVDAAAAELSARTV
jgi:hypothetical protein